MPNNYPDWAIELADPLFSNKFLKFEDIDITDKEEKINEGIKKIYDENEPIYFEHRTGETKEQTRERLNELTINPLFRNQIERCTVLLQEWISHHFPEQAQTFIQRLNIFKDHLMTNHFFDHRSFMYSDAKKNFETIITFLNEPLLPENFLKNQISNLLSENSLELCSEGCNTLLGTVAEALRNFGSFSVPKLSREFLIQHIEIEALRPFSSLRLDNAVETILAVLDLSERGNEVHGVNYLKNKASVFFGLPFLSVRDKFQENYDDRLTVRADDDTYSQKNKKKATDTVDNYLKQCRDKLTANNFIEFISRKLQEDLTVYHDAELINRLKTQLSQIGEDQGFSFYEIVDIGEKTTLKTDLHAFKITIAERLIASSYFEIDNSPNSRLRHNNSPFKRRNQISNNLNFLDQFELKPGDADYKVYFSNIDLTWVKIPDGEEGQQRQLFIELLKDQQGPEKLNKIVPLETKIFLNQLIQNTNDLEQGIRANENINWLEKFFSLPVKSALIKRLLIKSEDIKPFCKKFITYFNSLTPFKDMSSNGRDVTITSRLVSSNPNFTKKILTHAIHYLGTISNIDEFNIFTAKMPFNDFSNFGNFVENLIESSFKDFSDLTFKSHSNLAFALDSYKTHTSSIAGIALDFKGVNLKNSVFELPIKNACFSNADLTGVQFKSILDGVDFKGANLFDTDFSNARLSNFAVRPYGLSRRNLPYNKIAINFEGALFSTTSFSQVLQLYLNLDPQYLTIDGELSRFKKLSFKGIRLEQVDFSDSDLHSILRSLGEIEFSNIELKNKVINFSGLSGVILKITSSDLEESTLKNFKGSLNLESCHIQDLTFENCDLSHSMFSKNQGLEYYQDTTLNLKDFLAFSSIGPSFREKDYSGVFLTDTPHELAGNNAWFDKQQRFLRFRLSGQAFSFLIKKGFRSFPYVNLKNAELHQVDLSEVDIEKAKLHGVKLKDVQLNLEQFILFCERNYKDLSEVAIKGKFSAEIAAELKLFGVKLSEEAARYLLENGVKDFTGADLQNTRNLFEEYVGKPGYLFENAVFPTAHAESFKRKSERQSHIEALGDSQSNYLHLESEMKRIFKRKIGDLHYGAINQWDTLNLEPINIPRRGRCLGFTKGFSESLRQGQMDAYLVSLKELARVSRRKDDGYLLSVEEKAQSQAFLDALLKLESEGLQESTWEQKYTIEQIKLKRAGLPQSLRLAVENIQEDYAIHLTLGSGARRPRHQVSISRMNSRYHYFDSNAGYVSGIEDPVQFMTLLKKVLLKSYGSESQQLEFEVYRVKTRDTLPGEEVYQGLFGFRSECSRLANQDQALGTLHLKDTTIVSRTSLYEWGLGYLDKSSKLIAPIDAKFVLTDETLLSGLEAKTLGINKQRYEERLSRFLREVSRLQEDGSEFKNELKTALDLLPWVHGLKGKESVAIKSALDRVLSGLTSEPPDLRIERRLGETPIKKQIEFEKRLIGEKLKRSVLVKAEETLRNQKKLFLKSGLSQFLLTKSIFDVGRSAVQGDWHSFGVGIGFLTYGGLIAPRLESWISETLPLKLKKMKSRLLKSTDALNGFDQMLKLGKKTQLAYRALAGGVSNVLDIYGLGVGIKQLVEAEYGSRAWEDGVFETTINSISLVGGVALVMLQTTGPAGPILAVVLVTADGLYYGIQKVKEYDNYKLTDQEKARLFWHGVLRLTDPQELEYLRDRQDMVDQLARQNWARLQQLPTHIVGIGAGLGEYVLNERWYYQEVNTTRLRRTPADRIKPGLSFMNLDRPSLDFKNSLSRILPKKPDPHARFICLPRNRGEPIEMERDFWYPGIAVHGIYQSSTTVKHECQNAFALADIRRQPDKLKEAMIWLDLGLVLRGKVTGFPGYGAVFEVHGSLSDLELRGSVGHTNRFVVVGDSFRGTIHGGVDGTNILDLTHIPIPVEVRTNERGVHGPQINLYKDNNPLFSANYIQVLYGRENKTDKIYCDSEVMNWEVPDLKIESRGGQLSNPDVIKYCKNVVLTGFSDYQSSALIWGKRSIAIMTEGKPGHIHIGNGSIEATNRPSMQSIQFLDTALLKELRFYYQINTNELVLEKDSFKVTLAHYFNFEQNRSNYALYDLSGSHVVPVLSKEVIESWQQVELFQGGKMEQVNLRHFTLYHRIQDGNQLHSLLEAEKYSEKNQKGNQPIQLVSVVSWPNSAAMGKELYWHLGSSGDDHLLLSGKTGAAKGGKGADNYYISSMAKDMHIVNFDEESGKPKIDQLVLSENLPVPSEWMVINTGTNLVLSSDSHLGQSNRTQIHLSHYLSSADHQHLIIRYHKKDDRNSFWLPLKVSENQYRLTRYYPGESEVIHRVSSLSLSKVLVIEADKLENFRGLHAGKDLILEVKASREKWVFENYYVDPMQWQDFKICITENAALLSLLSGDKQQCLEEDSLFALSELAIKVQAIEAEVRDQQIKRHPLKTRRLRRDVIQQHGPCSSVSEKPLVYLDIPQKLNVLKVIVYPEGENQENLSLNIHASERNYTIEVKEWARPGSCFAGLRYGSLELNTDQWISTSDWQSLQINLDLGLLHLQLKNHLITLLPEERKQLTIWQLALLFHFDLSNDEDLVNYFSQVEKGLDLLPQELSTYLRWLEDQPAENWLSQIKTVLESPTGINILLYLAMQAATRTDLSQEIFDRCFSLLDDGSRQVLWEKVSQTFGPDKIPQQQLAELALWVNIHAEGIREQLRTKIEMWERTINISVPLAILSKEHHYQWEKHEVALSKPSVVEKQETLNDFQSWRWTQLMLSAAGGSFITVAGFMSYIFIRRYLDNRRGLNGVATLAIPAVAQALLGEGARATESIIGLEKALEDKTVMHYKAEDSWNSAEACFKSESVPGLGMLAVCDTSQVALIWLTTDQGLAWYGLNTMLQFNPTTAIEKARAFYLNPYELAYIASDGHQQSFNVTAMREVPFAALYHILPVEAKEKLDVRWKNLSHERMIARFTPQAIQLGSSYLLGECLLHTQLGDALQAVGLKPNWHENDHRYWAARFLSTGSQLMREPSNSLTNVSAILLETMLLSPKVQASYAWLLPKSEFRSGKQAIRFLANLLQFGFTYTAYLPSTLEWFFSDYKGIHAISLGLRAVLSLFAVSNDPCYYYLGLALFLLPQLPTLLEHVGIPVTVFVTNVLEKLTQLLLFKSLMNGLGIKTDSARVEAKDKELQVAYQRVQAGQKSVYRCTTKLLFFRTHTHNEAEKKTFFHNGFIAPVR